MIEQLEGVLVMWDARRGFGFIRPDGGDRDLFVGAGAFEAAGIEEPEMGARYAFSMGADRSGRARAENLRWPGADATEAAVPVERPVFNPVRQS